MMKWELFVSTDANEGGNRISFRSDVGEDLVELAEQIVKVDKNAACILSVINPAAINDRVNQVKK